MDESSDPEKEAVVLPPAIKMSDIWFRYERDGEDILRGVNLSVPDGKLTCIVGGNGTGKSTALKVISGVRRPYRGKVFLKGEPLEKMSGRERYQGLLGVLPQDPCSIFAAETVFDDLFEILEEVRRGDPERLSDDEKTEKVKSISMLLEIDGLLNRHPYDLSGGEQQRAALAKIMLLDPEIILLDEPTKGMDSHFKERFSIILRALLDRGKTILMVSHDVEFCAKYADLCALFFDGTIVAKGEPADFFSGNSFYTTAANRMSRRIFEKAITAKDVITLCKDTILR